MIVARRLLVAATGRWQLGSEIVESKVSCGVALDIGGEHTAERLIAEADLAMYEQKRDQGTEPGLFEPEMFVTQRMELDRDDALRSATTDGSLEVHYQPFVDLATDEVIGYEALLRWSFDGRLLGPDEFIPLAERRGLIDDIGGWVIDRVCAQAASRRDRTDCFFTVNVSPVQLRGSDLAERIGRALHRHDLPASSLGLELTEGVMIADTEQATRTLQHLADSGILLIVDDFGTGFASLDYLRTLPVGGFKIDRSFVWGLDQPRSRAIVAGLLGLAETLDLWLVAEGIETAEQAAALQAMGARVGQGYHFARPAPLEIASRR